MRSPLMFLMVFLISVFTVLILTDGPLNASPVIQCKIAFTKSTRQAYYNGITVYKNKRIVGKTMAIR